MPLELKELTTILERAEDPEVFEEAVRTAIQALFFHQIIYEDTSSVPGSALQALRDHRGFFEKYFSAAGYDLVVDIRSQMFALRPAQREKPPYGWRLTRLKKDETLARLALRHLFERGFLAGEMDETGRVQTDTVELVDVFQKMAGSRAPNVVHLIETLLRDLQRKGVVRLGEREKEAM